MAVKVHPLPTLASPAKSGPTRVKDWAISMPEICGLPMPGRVAKRCGRELPLEAGDALYSQV